MNLNGTPPDKDVEENNPRMIAFGRLPREIRLAKSERKIKKIQLNTEVATLRRYIGRARGDTLLAPKKTRSTRTTSTKQKYMLDIDCLYCSNSYVELFETEATHLLLNLPVECEHGARAFDLVVEPHGLDIRGPGLTIPAIELAGALSTTGSAVGLDKLSRQLESVRQSKIELQAAQNSLIRLVETDYEQLGETDKFTEDSLTCYMRDAIIEADSVVALADSTREELVRLAELDSALDGRSVEDSRPATDDGSQHNSDVIPVEPHSDPVPEVDPKTKSTPRPIGPPCSVSMPSAHTTCSEPMTSSGPASGVLAVPSVGIHVASHPLPVVDLMDHGTPASTVSSAGALTTMSWPSCITRVSTWSSQPAAASGFTVSGSSMVVSNCIAPPATAGTTTGTLWPYPMPSVPAPRMSAGLHTHSRLHSETDPFFLAETTSAPNRLPPPFPRGILRNNTVTAASERARFDAELLSHTEEVKRRERSARLDLATIHAMNRSQRAKFSAVVSTKLQDMIARMEKRLIDMQASVQEVLVRAGANSLQGSEVKNLVGRLSEEVDNERRAADEADLNAPESLPACSTDKSLDSRDSQGSFKSGFIEKAKIPSFNGKLEEYVDFKSQFKDLTRFCGHPPSALLQQLSSHGLEGIASWCFHLGGGMGVFG